MAKALVVAGLKDVEKALGTLAPRESKNLMRRVVVGVAREARNRIRKRAPKKTGTLRRAIRHRRRRGKPGFFEAGVFVTHGPGVKHDAYYWHFVEFGTAARSSRVTNQGKPSQRTVRGHAATPPQPFIVPTVVEMRFELKRIYREEFGRQLEKQLAKRTKRR